MSIEDTFNFRRISDRLTTSGLVNAVQLADLQGEGYQAVINLLPDDYEHAVHEEGDLVRDQGLDYVYIPVDFDAPTHDDFVAFSDAMRAHADDTVHVHCAANYRVSAFYGLYAQSQGLCTESDADALVQELWNPVEFPRWAEFMAAERARMT
ncbi:MAG TPA: protein tyrosine phosphatase family protein [Acidimicrobiia bacterium]|jgi:protein tyrosine phosphatase (PTP) superfamily phosphohydrolase (DUF442 family)